MHNKFLDAIEDCVRAVEQLKLPAALSFMQQTAQAMAECFARGNKVILAGNGGSLCDAAHFAEELTGQFRKMRPPLPAIALSEPGHLTCVGNDMGFECVFSRGVEAFGVTGDIFVGLTTSGNSPNIIKAFEAAKRRGLLTIAFLGKGGGKLKGVANYELIIEGFATSDRIQEAHMSAIHLIIEQVENLLFYQENLSPPSFSATFTIASGIGRLQSASIEERFSEIAKAIPSSRSSISAAFRSASSTDEIVKIASFSSDNNLSLTHC